MAAYQQGTKRQKVREVRDNDFFQGIDKMDYNSMAGAGEAARYRFYNSGERVHNKTMEEWLKYSVSLTEFRNSDSRGRHNSRAWDDNTNSLENHKRCIKALYDFCSKLGVRYWTAFDTDLIPVSDNWDEVRASWDEVVEYVAELNQRYHLKLLWIAPDLHSHPKYSSGAFTSNDATTFTQAAAQIKKCIEVSQRLNAECFLIWPYREGYNSIFHTDVAKEIKLFTKLLKITAEYKDRLNYRCQLLVMPYGNNWGHGHWGQSQHCLDNDLVNRYMWDITSCLYMLKSGNLERYYKVVTPPGHHMYMANVYNMLGGVTVSNNTDQYNSKNLTLMMKCIVDQGTAPPGGISLRLPWGGDVGDFITSHVKYVDALARALRFACALLNDQLFSKHLQQRYSTYHSGFGSRLVSNEISMEECEEYYKKNHGTEPSPSKCEQLELAFQRYLDTSDHI